MGSEMCIRDRHPIVQTGAIARFCGKLSGLYPKNDDLFAAQIDQVLDLATDITVLVASTGRENNEEEKRQKREALADGELARKLSIMEKNIKPHCNWINGDSIGLEDIAIWRLMGWLSSGSIDGIPVTILKNYPKIQRVCSNVDTSSKVQEWIKLTYQKNYNRGNYG